MGLQQRRGRSRRSLGRRKKPPRLRQKSLCGMIQGGLDGREGGGALRTTMTPVMECLQGSAKGGLIVRRCAGLRKASGWNGGGGGGRPRRQILEHLGDMGPSGRRLTFPLTLLEMLRRVPEGWEGIGSRRSGLVLVGSPLLFLCSVGVLEVEEGVEGDLVLGEVRLWFERKQTRRQIFAS